MLEKQFDACSVVVVGLPQPTQEAPEPATNALPWYRIERSWPPFDTHLSSQVLVLVNEHRKRLGLGSLSNNMVLRKSARWKSCHMAEFLYMSHNDPAVGAPPVPPVDRNWYDRLRAAGWGGAAGENIAYGFLDAESVMGAWLSDEGHKQNVENPSWSGMGVGVAASRPTSTNLTPLLFWTNDFGA